MVVCECVVCVCVCVRACVGVIVVGSCDWSVCGVYGMCGVVCGRVYVCVCVRRGCGGGGGVVVVGGCKKILFFSCSFKNATFVDFPLALPKVTINL